MNRYRLLHTTDFVYDGPVSESYNEVRLRPMHDERQSCLSFRLTTNPGSRGTAYRDAHGNWVHQFNVLAEHQRLRVEAESVVLAHDPGDPLADGTTLADFDAHSNQLDEEHFDFLAPTGYVPHLAQLKEIIVSRARPSYLGDRPRTSRRYRSITHRTRLTRRAHFFAHRIHAAIRGLTK